MTSPYGAEKHAEDGADAASRAEKENAMTDPEQLTPITVPQSHADLECPECAFTGTEDGGFFVMGRVLLNGTGSPVNGAVSVDVLAECMRCGTCWCTHCGQPLGVAIERRPGTQASRQR